MAKPKIIETVEDIRGFEAILGRQLFWPMSHDANELIVAITNRLNKRINVKQLASEFARQYQQISYEEAILRWDKSGIIRILRDNKTWANKSDEQLINIALLNPLYNREWNIQQIPYGTKFSTGVADLYDYLTQHVLIKNFSKSELHDIVSIDQSGISIKELQRIVSNIKQPDKRTIAYINAICKSESSKTEALKIEQENHERRGNEALARYLKAIQEPAQVKVKYDPDWMNDIEITRKMYEE